MPEPLAYLNGRMLPASDVHLEIYDAGVVQGATVTETMRTFHHRLYRLEDHLDRLQQSLRCARFDLGMLIDDIARVVRELTEHNAKLLAPDDDLGLVLFVTAGPYPTYAAGNTAARGLAIKPTICAHTFPLPFELWAEKMQRGVRLVTPSIRQIPPECLPPHLKCRSRMHFYLADQQAKLVDPDAVALLLDLEGNVRETSTANFLCVDDGSIVSPPEEDVLPGISRLVVKTLAETLGVPFVEREFQVVHANNADEAFLASTPFCLMPVQSINGTPIGNGRPGEIYRRLLEAWSQEVQLDVLQQIVDGARRRLRLSASPPRQQGRL